MKKPEANASGFFLYKICSFESRVRSVLCNGAESFCGDLDRDVLVDLRNVDALLVEVRRALDLPARVKLRRTRAV